MTQPGDDAGIRATTDAKRLKTLGVILSGGQARRMGGGDKCLRAAGGVSLLERVRARLAPQCGALVLNANGDPARFATFGLEVAPDSVPGFVGPLAGVLAGLEAAEARRASAIVTAAADTPFFPLDLAARLHAAAEAAGLPLACAATRGADGALRDHPTFGLWPTALADDLRRALVEEELRKIVLWTERHGCARAVFELADGRDPFFNVNTPEDLAEAERIAAAGAA